MSNAACACPGEPTSCATPDPCDQCHTLSELLRLVANQLCDTEPGFEHQLYQEGLLVQYYNQAISATFVAKRESFVEIRDFPLSPGANQVLPQCVDSILEVATIVVDGVAQTPSKSLTKNATRTDKLAGFFASASCSQSKADISYSLSETSGREFTVAPPIPESPRGAPAGDSTAIARVRAVILPPHATPGSTATHAVPPELWAAVYEYIMYLARSKDVESEHDAQFAANHLAAWLQLVGLDFRAYTRMRYSAEHADQEWRAVARGVNR